MSIGQDWLCVNLSFIAESAAAIFPSIAVEALAIASRSRHADTVPGSGDWREIAHDDCQVTGTSTAAQMGERAAFRVVDINTLEACGLDVELVERRLAAIETVEIAHSTLHTAMHGIIEKLPIETYVVVPLALLSEFAVHEEKFLAWMRPHETEVGSKIGETLPAVAWHLRDERAFSMHHFVVR